jgi:hypothetical protein
MNAQPIPQSQSVLCGLVIGGMGDEECASAEDERLSPRTVKLAYVRCCRGMGAPALLFPSTAEARGSESCFIGP